MQYAGKIEETIVKKSKINSKKSICMRETNVACAMLLVQVASSLSSLPKQNYTIGGWITGTPAVLMQLWNPIFGDYLTNVVGTQYDPPVTFDFFPIDYTEATRLETLIQKDVDIDFLCE